MSAGEDWPQTCCMPEKTSSLWSRRTHAKRVFYAINSHELQPLTNISGDQSVSQSVLPNSYHGA